MVGSVCIGIKENLQLTYGLRLYNKQPLQLVPSHLQRRICQFGFKNVLNVENECVESSIGYEFLVRIVLFVVGSLAVYVVALGLIEHHAFETAESHASHLVLQLTNQGHVLQTRGVDDLYRGKSLYGRDGADVGESLYNLAEVDLSVDCVVHGQPNLS